MPKSTQAKPNFQIGSLAQAYGEWVVISDPMPKSKFIRIICKDSAEPDEIAAWEAAIKAQSEGKFGFVPGIVLPKSKVTVR